MGKINRANLKKTIYYLKRNGIRNTWYAVKERLDERRMSPYQFIPVSEDELQCQREDAGHYQTTFSIVVPAYRTNKIYLQEMIASVIKQTYPRWELIIADATEDDSVKQELYQWRDSVQKMDKQVQLIAESHTQNLQKAQGLQKEQTVPKPQKNRKLSHNDAQWQDKCIRYVRLEKNAGIAANTNQALFHVKGEYTGLLDHDDVLTPNALYEMAASIEEGKKAGIDRRMLYSDEDKCNGDMTHFYEPNWKEDFNQELLLSNNYICHFLVLESKLIKELGFRSEYDGAQDYDLVLRAVEKLLKNKEPIVHIPKVLYHWRCHTGSTAENPQSKQYAYDAGLRAVQDFADRQGYQAKAEHLRHLGFYNLCYPKGILKTRTDLGAVGGRIIIKGKNAGGRMTENGKVYYEGLPEAYSGYMHRVALTQDAESLDIRCIEVREELWELFEQVTGVSYKELSNDTIFDTSVLPEGTDYKKVSLALSKAIKEQGYRLLYDPKRTEKWDAKNG